MANVFSSLTPEWFRARRYHLLSPLVMLAVIAVFGVTPHLSWLAELLEDQTVNLRFMARAPFDRPADQRLIFVGIDELSLAHLGRYPWPRRVQGRLLEDIAKSGVIPHTISYDIMFTEKTNQLDAQSAAPQSGAPPAVTTPAPLDDDAYLAQQIANLPSVITGALTVQMPEQRDEAEEYIKRTQEAIASPGSTQPITNIRGDITQLDGSDAADFPIPAIRNQSLFGFVNDNPSVDDIRHTLPLAVRVGNAVYPSLALQTLCQMLSVDADKVEIDLPGREVRMTDISKKTWRIPIDEHGRYFINYRRQDTFASLSFFGLGQNLERHNDKNEPISAECDLNNKTLLIGESATGLVDMGPSPLAAKSPLPFAHLNVINNVLKHDYLTFVPWYWVALGWLISAWVTLLRLRVAPLKEAVGMPILATVVYVVVAFTIFAFWSINIALAWPVLGYAGVNFGGVVLRWREEQRKSQALRNIFSQMVAPEVMNHILKNPGNMELGGSDRPATIMFSDLRDFTGFSEGKTAKEVMDQLNDYFERMVACVKNTKGTLHKFIGDAIMAAWGDIADASQGPEQDARNAVRAALVMRPRLRELNEERLAKGLVPLRIGVGLNYGVVQAGMLGSSERKEFTVIGDEVNVASRLEGMTKEFKTDLAISESVRVLVGDEFLVRRLGLILLKGKKHPIVVFEVLAEKGNFMASKMKPETVARYEDAFDHFLARRFGKAVEGFEACAKEYPDDYCVKNYLAASREYLVTPPPEDWDGRIVMTTK